MTAIRRVARRTAFDARVVEDRDRPAALLEVEEGGRPVALLARQVAASRSYGWPSAAGGMLRPTTPARIDDRHEVRQRVEELRPAATVRIVAQLAGRRRDVDRLADAAGRARTGAPRRTPRAASSARRSSPPGR